ncbi:HAD family hydrolase [Chelatococcus asaccharovorans]|uniref:2-haloacid dehalogenase n=1 Tax=Chelatococcus asaccharovorans TaxID=28210 RepID=A0A2V3TZ31_9HYPH|nr:HAD family phosphatase [Chelatococcus asaccharovorans]MBS7704817.1 HAD family phosphatase [Chelatococcus asaccharovorans]PXW54714.1 2-haloacid dehalogenase [Chelatococcus asaccharovorans]
MRAERSRPRVVVFDVGAVLIEWDPRHLYRKIFAADEARMEQFLAEVCTPAWNLEQDRGRPWSEAVAERTALFPDWGAEIAAFDTRWSEMVPHAIDGTVALLGALRSTGVPTYAITNFSADKFAIARERFPFLADFDGIVVSGEVRLVKPDPAIFSLFLEQNGLTAAECLFVDDNPDNIATAQAMGFTAHLFRKPELFADALKASGFSV